FFFQAEDGIRDFHVTGVQTCALPIFPLSSQYGESPRPASSMVLSWIRTAPLDTPLSLKSRGAEFLIFRRSLIKRRPCPPWDALRSEEHTSELQSRENLVCRLLLEKKK